MTTTPQRFAILAGLPGSGKSTLARHLKLKEQFYVISSDAVRLALNGGLYPRESTGDYAALEPLVWKLVEDAAEWLLKQGHSVAIDAMNLTRWRRASWREFARQRVPDIPVAIWWCDGNWDSAARWQKERNISTEEYQIIRSKIEGLLEIPGPEEGCEVWHGLRGVRLFPEPADRTPP